ncbi:MAG: DNA translocase FtsK 4TM domain-containing protein, partial [Gordonia sp. (in: high G+C Gram-positive bacteria)]
MASKASTGTRTSGSRATGGQRSTTRTSNGRAAGRTTGNTRTRAKAVSATATPRSARATSRQQSADISTRPAPSAAGAVGRGVGRGLGASWSLLARGVGAVVRTGGDTDAVPDDYAADSSRADSSRANSYPGHTHRRDGVALALLGVALLVSVGVWFGAAGPVGAFIDALIRSLVGNLAVLVPIALGATAVMLMRRGPNPQRRARYLGSGILIVLPALGLIHLLAGAPRDLPGRSHAGGLLGYVVGSPLTAGVTAWVSVPILLLCMAFG